MEEEDWFKATGKADVGFKTQGTRIKVGGSFGGQEVGAECRGETGVVCSGETAGVSASGKQLGVSASSEVVGVSASGKQFGVVGRGVDGGRGGRFAADELTAQLQLKPDRMTGLEIAEQGVEPRELIDAPLPRMATIGDLYMVAGRGKVALWLCVASAQGDQGAQWRQVLLGNTNEGQK